MFLLVYLFVHSGPMGLAFYGAEMRHQGTPAPRVYPLLLVTFGRKHTVPRFRSPRVYPLLLLAVGRKHTVPRLPSPQVGSIFRPQTAPNNTVGCPRECIKIYRYKQSFTFWYSSVSAPSAYPLCLYTMSPLPSSSSV